MLLLKKFHNKCSFGSNYRGRKIAVWRTRLSLKSDLWQSVEASRAQKRPVQLSLKSDLWQSCEPLFVLARLVQLSLKSDLWQSTQVKAFIEAQFSSV